MKLTDKNKFILVAVSTLALIGLLLMHGSDGIILAGLLLLFFWGKNRLGPIGMKSCVFVVLAVFLIVKRTPAGFVLALLSIPALAYLLRPLSFEASAPESVDWKTVGWIVLCTACFAAICSTSSFLYPINNSRDPNFFMTVGKALTQGKVLYRDVYEQKGLYLFWIHSLASIFAGGSFVFIYFVEVAFLSVFFVYSAKMVQLVQPKTNVYFAMPVLMTAFFVSQNFWYGDNAEELCLMFQIIPFYWLLKAYMDKKPLTVWQLVCVGLLSSFVFWVKYTLVGFYLGWFAGYVWLLIRLKRLDRVLPAVLLIGGGVILGSLPAILYFGLNGALPDLWTGYFVNNMKGYQTDGDPLWLRLWYRGKDIVKGSFLQVVFLFLSCFYICISLPWFALPWFLCLGCTVLFSIGMGMFYPYYSQPLALYLPFALPVLSVCLQPVEKRKIYSIFVSGLCLGYAFLFTDNRYALLANPSDFPQYRFSQLVKDVKDATLLEVGLDSGYYNYAGIDPNVKYFCTWNVVLDEQIQQQKEILENGTADFVVSTFAPIESGKYVLLEEYDEPLRPDDVGYARVYVYASQSGLEKLQQQ